LRRIEEEQVPVFEEMKTGTRISAARVRALTTGTSGKAVAHHSDGNP
jgi:hypothetical protein